MSITSDFRSYADSALEQSKQVIEQAQARLTGARGDASGLADKAATKASETYTDLRTKGEALRERVSSLPAVEQVGSTVEPYVAQLNGLRLTLVEKVEQVYAELKTNEQVAKVLGVAEQAAGVIVGTVNDRVVNPVKARLEPEPGPEHAAAPAAPTAEVTVPAEATIRDEATAPAKAPAATKTASAAKATPAAKATSAAKATPAKRTSSRRAES
jgi:hypothetical protein